MEAQTAASTAWSHRTLRQIGHTAHKIADAPSPNGSALLPNRSRHRAVATLQHPDNSCALERSFLPKISLAINFDLLASRTDLRAHRRRTRLQEARHFSGRETLDIAQHNRQAFFLRQRRHGPHHQLTLLCPNE